MVIDEHTPVDSSTSQSFSVMPISPGVAIGPARIIRPASSLPASPAASIAPAQVEAEQRRLHAAIEQAIQELRDLAARVATTVGQSGADIFEAQQLMLEDPELLSDALEYIAARRLPAAAAFQQAAELQARELEAIDNELIAARAADIRDVAARVLRYLNGAGEHQPASKLMDHPIMILANDLTPSDTAAFDPETILGIATVIGGPTTHAAIIARALEIPAIAGIDARLLDALQEGQQFAIDGTKGHLYTHLAPDQAQALTTAMHRRREERIRRRSQNDSQWLTRPGSTADGVAVQIFANVGDAAGARAAAEAGAEGIGLLRTEFLFGNRAVFPDEQEQFESYAELFAAFGDHARFGKTIIARTLDAGADKPFPALEPLIGSMQEANPALGVRGARIHLLHETLLRSQLRALLRAGAATGVDLSIMFPMIATLEEVRRLRAVYTSVQQELTYEGARLSPRIQFGIMVETPAAALMAAALAREVDFFSIGANDLFQYTMAADRTNTRVTALFGQLEPAVWHAIDMVARAATARGKLVAVCGELAADPRIGPLLAGLGVKELSMSSPSIVQVKAALNARTMDYWQKKARELLEAETAAEVEAVLETITN
jgi:phosphoenolpyruvate-protein phosphotransferase